MIQELFHQLLNFDQVIFSFVENYGMLTFLLVFVIIFFETGIVIFPFLPGDSLIFALGIIAKTEKINFLLIFITITIAAILGDSLNYYIGEKFGKFILKKNLIKKKHYDYSYNLYEKHGGKIIIYARFMPIVRTLAPFIAGGSKMNYSKFIVFNILGAILWSITFLLIGYFLGNIPIIRENIFWTILIIVILSILSPILINPIKRIFRRKNKNNLER